MNEAEYERALTRIEEIFSAEAGTAEAEELEQLSEAVMAYEDKHFPLPEITAEDAACFRFEQETGVSLRPVWAKGQVLLYDIYVGERWFGSRRTIHACELVLGEQNLARFPQVAKTIGEVVSKVINERGSENA